MDLNVDFEKFTYFLEYLKKEYLDKLCELESLKVRNIENENILKMKVDECENILSEKQSLCEMIEILECLVNQLIL